MFNMRNSLNSLLFVLLSKVGLSATNAPAQDSTRSAALRTDGFKTGDWENDIGYRQAVRVGNVLHISGSVGAGDIPKAIRAAYGTLRKPLTHYGLGFENVVKENIYTTDLDALKANLPLRREFYGKDFSAATWVQVARLYEPNDVIEVELIAIFPN